MVQQIEINGKAVRVLFGMHFIQNLSNHLQETATTGGIDEDEIPALIVWYGYLCWCKISKEPPTLSQVDIAIGIEMIYHNDDDKLKDDLAKILTAYNSSKFGKAVQQVTEDEEAKKKLIGQKLDNSPLES